MIEFGPRSKDKVSFDTALLYCMTLDHEGYCNWRLPVADETVLETLFDVEVWVNENEKNAFSAMFTFIIEKYDTGASFGCANWAIEDMVNKHFEWETFVGKGNPYSQYDQPTQK